MSFVPSLRECLHRLDRVRDTAQVAAALDALNEEEQAAELTAASRRLVELHHLCLHLAANMSGGAGIPPTPAVKTPTIAQPPAPPVTAKAKPPVTHWTRTPAVKPQRSVGHVTVKELAKSLNRSTGWLYKRMLDAGFPRPVIAPAGSRSALWDSEAVHAWVAEFKPPVNKRKPKVVSDATTYTTAEAAAALGLVPASLLVMRSRGDHGLDIVPSSRGVSILWPRPLIDRVATERIANPPRQGRPARALSVTTAPENT